ncbi:unnamed protein product [Urochloa decumbens]|uniref:Peptidase A1 domain-containing protein n=1 Tax=Urochloa decumbens TaxID=240449 RepID=A0ABC8WH71_9POAL
MIMPGRSVASAVLLLALLHGLLLRPPQLPVARAEIDDDDGEEIKEGSSIHFDVTPPVVPDGAEARREHFRALHAKDMLRHVRIASMRNGSGGDGGGRHLLGSSKLPELMSDPNMFVELPMRSALNIAHVGMYLVSVRFGTPALPFNLVLDTANDLTWISCRLRRRKGKHYGRASPAAAAGQTMSVGEGGEPVKQEKKKWYRPALSSSWRRIRCSQSLCEKLSYTTCPDALNTVSCSYRQKVQDGTLTIGIYGMEKATVALSDGKMAKLPGLVLGCSLKEAGGSVDAHDGVLGLGNGIISFGVNAASRFGGRFSFCLLSTNSGRDASSYLTFGPNPAVMGPETMETRIIYNKDVTVGMGFHVDAVTVDGKPLDIPPEVFDDTIRDAGVILDTGTSLTGLVPPAYDAVTAALDSYLAHLPRVTDIAGFEFCYNWTFTGDGVDPANNVTVPRFALELEGGAVLEVDAKSVVMPEVEPGVACLAFRKLTRGPSIIGNVLMQEHIWEFEHRVELMRFRKDKCVNHHIKGVSAANVHHIAPTPIPSPRFIN